MARELAEALKKEIAETKSRLSRLEEMLRKEMGAQRSVGQGVLSVEGKPIRPTTTTAKAADALQRILRNGKKTMQRDALDQVLGRSKTGRWRIPH